METTELTPEQATVLDDLTGRAAHFQGLAGQCGDNQGMADYYNDRAWATRARAQALFEYWMVRDA